MRYNFIVQIAFFTGVLQIELLVMFVVNLILAKKNGNVAWFESNFQRWTPLLVHR